MLELEGDEDEDWLNSPLTPSVEDSNVARSRYEDKDLVKLRPRITTSNPLRPFRPLYTKRPLRLRTTTSSPIWAITLTTSPQDSDIETLEPDKITGKVSVILSGKAADVNGPKTFCTNVLIWQDDANKFVDRKISLA